MNTIVMKQGNLLPILRRPLELAGEPVNLSGATVEFRFWLQDGTGPVRSGPCVIVDEVNGIVDYRWQTGDTDVAGIFIADFTATIGGRAISFPNFGYERLVITAKIPDPVSP